MAAGGETVWSLFFKFLNFGVLLAILIKFVGKPLKNYLKNRSQGVKETIEETQKALNEAEELRETYRAKLLKLDEEIEAYRQRMQQEGEKEKAKIIDDALRLAAKIKEQARLTAEQDQKEIISTIKEKISKMTIEQAQGLIVENIKSSDHDRMVEDFIVKLRSLN